MSNIEQTLSIIKPDAVERNLDNEIKEMFKNKGFSIVKEKKIQIEKSEAEKFYKVHEQNHFIMIFVLISVLRTNCSYGSWKRKRSIRQ